MFEWWNKWKNPPGDPDSHASIEKISLFYMYSKNNWATSWLADTFTDPSMELPQGFLNYLVNDTSKYLATSSTEDNGGIFNHRSFGYSILPHTNCGDVIFDNFLSSNNMSSTPQTGWYSFYKFGPDESVSLSYNDKGEREKINGKSGVYPKKGEIMNWQNLICEWLNGKGTHVKAGSPDKQKSLMWVLKPQTDNNNYFEWVTNSNYADGQTPDDYYIHWNDTSRADNFLSRMGMGPNNVFSLQFINDTYSVNSIPFPDVGFLIGDPDSFRSYGCGGLYGFFLSLVGSPDVSENNIVKFFEDKPEYSPDPVLGKPKCGGLFGTSLLKGKTSAAITSGFTSGSGSFTVMAFMLSAEGALPFALAFGAIGVLQGIAGGTKGKKACES
jgi:hypothetical protein